MGALVMMQDRFKQNIIPPNKSALLSIKTMKQNLTGLLPSDLTDCGVYVEHAGSEGGAHICGNSENGPGAHSAAQKRLSYYRWYRHSHSFSSIMPVTFPLTMSFKPAQQALVDDPSWNMAAILEILVSNVFVCFCILNNLF